MGSIISEIAVKNNLNAKIVKRGYSDFVLASAVESAYDKNGITAQKICETALKMCRGEM